MPKQYFELKFNLSMIKSNKNLLYCHIIIIKLFFESVLIRNDGSKPKITYFVRGNFTVRLVSSLKMRCYLHLCST